MEARAFELVKKLVSPDYLYEVYLHADGSVTLEGPANVEPCKWISVRSFLFGTRGIEFSVFMVVKDRLRAMRLGMDMSPEIDDFCRDNAWMSDLAECKSAEELVLRMTVMGGC